MEKPRLRVAVVVLVALVASVVGWSTPAEAVSPLQAPDLAVTIDCSSLQAGYYQSAHVTGSISGLAPSTQYTVSMRGGPDTRISGITLTSDGQGAAVLDTVTSAHFVVGSYYTFTLSAGQTAVFAKTVPGTSCTSGVAATGSLTADMSCPTRYLDEWGDEMDTSYRIHGTLSGFVPGEPYTFFNSYSPVQSPQPIVADANGVLAVDFTTDSGRSLSTLGDDVYTTSQTLPVASENFVKNDPCPAMRTSFPADRPTELDIDGNGNSDIAAIDMSGRLLYFKNDSASNAGHLPFTSSQTIGSGWGPQFGMRLETAGDLTGDFFSEIVVVRSDGTLVAYYNNMGSNPGHLPYASGTVIGSGWQSFTNVTLGDVNHDGLADIIAKKSDGTYWLYANHYPTNPGHLPFTSGVQIPVQDDGSSYGFAAADLNSDGYADLWFGGGEMDINRAPAGNATMFPDAFGFVTGRFRSLDGYVPRAGWAVGHFEYWTPTAGLVIANPNGDGTLLYVEDPTGTPWTADPKVIGSGWNTIRQIIS
ncbi:hypothetical protein ASF88_17945 [Leifsonia sp. Leaf336]|uniref:FG-GAP repeat domain-containing protein n=1 Tax=Leifsonia sp. Leaf336 TaxID=1736341 RepID=UPI0006F6F6B0|nr:VCBS repeat-containing protein [Leifsonia sp. Leaf336]KQR51076.1 hypothetical protein ASF88_17945 [Leifsonia sp. Leaf336]